MDMLKQQLESFLEGINYSYYAFFRFDVSSHSKEEIIEKYGFDYLDPINIMKFYTTANYRPKNFITSYPNEWLDHYFANQYHKIDPVFEKGRKGFLPFEWGEGVAFPGQMDTPEKEEMLEQAKEYNIYRGITVPLGTNENTKAVFTLTFGKEINLINNTRFFALAWHMTHLGNFICYLQDKHDNNESIHQEDLVEIYNFLSGSHHSCKAFF